MGRDVGGTCPEWGEVNTEGMSPRELPGSALSPCHVTWVSEASSRRYCEYRCPSFCTWLVTCFCFTKCRFNTRRPRFWAKWRRGSPCAGSTCKT